MQCTVESGAARLDDTPDRPRAFCFGRLLEGGCTLVPVGRPFLAPRLALLQKGPGRMGVVATESVQHNDVEGMVLLDLFK